MKRIVLTIAVATLLGGCGAEWFPEKETTTPGSPTSTTSTSSATIDSSEVGTLVASVRVGPGAYTVTTTKGVFSTYTSLDVPYKTAVSMEKYTDPGTKLLVGKLLKALTRTILIKDILALVS